MSFLDSVLRVWGMTNRIRVPHVGRFALLLSVCVAGASCSSGGSNPIVPPPPPPPPPAAVASVEMSAQTASIEIGATAALTATPRDATGTALAGRSITWSSSSAAIATVADGVVTGVSAGIATITATSEGKSATAQITVNALPPLSCSASAPTGRLEFIAADNAYRYTTGGGWTVTVVGVGQVVILNPLYGAGGTKVEFWGDVFEVPDIFSFGHENLNGKHIKDRVGDQRTIHTLDGAIITLNANPNLGRISIYDHDQTHRLERVGQAVVVSRSCSLPFFEEELEPDGEASGFLVDAEGYLWQNLYDQGTESNGAPGPKIPNVRPLGRVNDQLPGNVQDYYDDPRLGHT